MKVSRPRRKGGLGVALSSIRRTPAEAARTRRTVRAHVAQVERSTPPLLVRLALYRAAPKGGCAVCWRDLVSTEHSDRQVYVCSRGDTWCSRLWRRMGKAHTRAQEKARAAFLEQVAA